MTGRGPCTAQAGMEPVLEQALAWLARSVGYDAARALAYDPAAMIAVSFVPNDRLDWDAAVSACWNKQAEADASHFRALARSKSHVESVTAEPRQGRQNPYWQNLLLPGFWRHEMRAAVVDGHGYCWGSITAFRNGQRPFRERDVATLGRELHQIAAQLSRAMVDGPVASLPANAASLWLSDDGELLFATPTGRDWLGGLQTPEMPQRAQAILAALTARVTADAHRSRHTAPPRPVSVRLRGGQGQWAVLHGERVIAPPGVAHGIS